MAHDGHRGSREDLSSFTLEELAESPSQRIKTRVRKLVPVGAIARAYLDYTRQRARLHPRPTSPPAGSQDSSERLLTPRSSISSGSRSLETSPNISARFSAVSLGTEEPPAYEVRRKSERFDNDSTKQPTTFHNLPPEIRRLVFKHVLHVEEVRHSVPVVEIPTLEQVNPTFVNLTQQRKADSVLDVLLVCRMFYHEAIPIFYENNLLRVSSPAMLYGFLKDLPRSRRQYLRQLRIGGLGFHYSGWQLAAKAFSLLGLCHNLEYLELELAWGKVIHGQPFTMAMWTAILGEQGDFNIATDPSQEEVTKEIRSSIVCLQALRGLRSVRFQMVGDDNPLLHAMDERLPYYQARYKMIQTASSWTIKTRSLITSEAKRN